MKKFFFISIHKPPASITFAPIKHALAVTVEPFKFSSRQGGVAYELSYRRQTTTFDTELTLIIKYLAPPID